MVTRLEMVVDALDRDFAHRQQEMLDAKFISTESKGRRGDMVRRSAHVLAYAHWEGFAKVALTSYLQYICDTRTKLGDLRPGFRAIPLVGIVRKSENHNEWGLASNLLLAIESSYASCLSVDPKSVIRSGNLNSTKLRELLQVCSLDYGLLYGTRAKFIDEVLLGRRNRIAHGELEPVGVSELHETIDMTLSLCKNISDQVSEALLYESYIAPSP